jgi:ketosteroid isomerase-like protein
VWKRELSFAQSVDSKNAQAFADHIHQGAVFNAGSPFPVRGREAIVQDWARLLKGDPLTIKWRPGRVTIGGDSTIAVSRGPFVMENKTKGAKPRFQVGTFSSVWVKGPDGVWRVQFDGTGSQPMGTDNAADVQKFMSRAPKSCNG